MSKPAIRTWERSPPEAGPNEPNAATSVVNGGLMVMEPPELPDVLAPELPDVLLEVLAPELPDVPLEDPLEPLDPLDAPVELPLLLAALEEVDEPVELELVTDIPPDPVVPEAEPLEPVVDEEELPEQAALKAVSNNRLNTRFMISRGVKRVLINAY